MTDQSSDKNLRLDDVLLWLERIKKELTATPRSLATRNDNALQLVELAIGTAMSTPSAATAKRLDAETVRAALKFGMHTGVIQQGEAERVAVNGAFDMNTVAEYLNGKCVASLPPAAAISPIRHATAYLDACKATRVALRFDDDTELDLPIHDFLAWVKKNVGASIVSATTEQSIPAALFDGYAVYEAMGKPEDVSPRNVAAVLDAVVRLIRTEGQ